ncbi:hypothetical protein [Pikeienuella sp. HZG-20]|uniref:hypothetical protein n=1 Tax=Paludibacillus litoralis TaxID=3133267 RepID=UPI0030EDEA3F
MTMHAFAGRVDRRFVASDQIADRLDVGAMPHETLSFLSDDHHAFAFVARGEGARRPGYLDLGPDAGFAADEALLFSGGLDSFAGALDEPVIPRHGEAEDHPAG